jgi:K+-transporting ATPase KdpF subunit
VDGSRVSVTNLVGLILAVALSIFLIVALMFPERF